MVVAQTEDRPYCRLPGKRQRGATAIPEEAADHDSHVAAQAWLVAKTPVRPTHNPFDEVEHLGGERISSLPPHPDFPEMP